MSNCKFGNKETYFSGIYLNLVFNLSCGNAVINKFSKDMKAKCSQIELYTAPKNDKSPPSQHLHITSRTRTLLQVKQS